MTPLLVKVGGAVAGLAAREVRRLGARSGLCVVHGAGPQISAEMERRGLEVRFVGGRRVTTREALAIVRESLANVNAELCTAIGVKAIGLMGDEIGLAAERVPHLGLVGVPVPVRPLRVLESLGQGLTPVVAPIAVGPLNINADDAAVALAVGLGAARLLFLTDTPGVLRGGEVLPALAVDDAEQLLAEGHFRGGIVPKLQAAVSAARFGVETRIGETAVIA